MMLPCYIYTRCVIGLVSCVIQVTAQLLYYTQDNVTLVGVYIKYDVPINIRLVPCVL